jgi:Tol biopolymer transport system component
VPEPVAAEQAVSNLSFSPDGSKIVFDTLGDVSEELWIMNRDGTERRRLISDTFRNRAPQWSPDGEEILFLSDRSGQYGNWIIRSDGSGLRPLTTPKTPNMQKAVWSPDGARVLAGRSPSPAVILYPHAEQPALSPTVAPGLEDAGYVLFNSWTAGPGGGMAVGELLSGSQAHEIVLYSYSEARLEHMGVNGRYSYWLRVNNDDPYRYFVFLRGGDCLLYDRSLKRETRLFSSAPNDIYAIATSPDGRWIYFTKTIRDADLWLAQLER